MTHIYFCRRNPKTYIATRRAASEEPEGTVRLYTNSASGGVFLSPDDARALAEQIATESYEDGHSMSNKVQVTVTVDPDEVRRHERLHPGAFDPDEWGPHVYAWHADLARQVLDALPPEPKFKPGDRVVLIKMTDLAHSPNAGRVGTVQRRTDPITGNPYVLMDGDVHALQCDPRYLVRIVEDGDQ